jgi:hypothetical protein
MAAAARELAQQQPAVLRIAAERGRRRVLAAEQKGQHEQGG